MYRIRKYRETDTMSNLINENYSILFVINRFGISLGFEDKTIGEICKEKNIDVTTFLTIVNMLIDEDVNDISTNISLSINTLLDYLQNSHKYFLQFKLPRIRKMLIESIGDDNSKVAIVILKFYDDYVLEVAKHMQYEEKKVFPYIRALINGEKTKGYNIDLFVKQHNDVELKLNELKNIIIRYCSVPTNNELINVLFDIFVCAEDLASHNKVENKLLVPTILDIEKKQ